MIPVHNREAIVCRTLDSVAANTASREVELIVVDNNSTDGSADEIRRWMSHHPEICTTLTNCPRPGATAARNTGLSMVRTPWVMFFDSDDVMLPRHLENILKTVRMNPDAELAGWEINQQLPSGRRLRAKFTTVRPMTAHLIHAILATQRFAARTELIRNAGGWDETVRGWNDYELGVRILLQKPKMIKVDVPVPQVITFFTEQSITGRTFSTDPDKWEHSLDTIEEHLKVSAPQYLPWIAYRRAVLAADYRREGDGANAERLLRSAAKTKPAAAKIIYLHHRFIHRGAYLIAKLLL